MSSFFEDEKNLRIKGYFSLVGHTLTTLLTGNTLSLLHFSNYYSNTKILFKDFYWFSDYII